jgi:hypothetical protein
VNLGSAGQGVSRRLVHLCTAGQGVNRQLVHLCTAGQGVNRQLVHLGGHYGGSIGGVCGNAVLNGNGHNARVFSTFSSPWARASAIIVQLEQLASMSQPQ